MFTGQLSNNLVTNLVNRNFFSFAATADKGKKLLSEKGMQTEINCIVTVIQKAGDNVTYPTMAKQLDNDKKKILIEMLPKIMHQQEKTPLKRKQGKKTEFFYIPNAAVLVAALYGENFLNILNIEDDRDGEIAKAADIAIIYNQETNTFFFPALDEKTTKATGDVVEFADLEELYTCLTQQSSGCCSCSKCCIWSTVGGTAGVIVAGLLIYYFVIKK